MILAHICCSVDSHYFLRRLRGEYPNEAIIGYFYDPNIHPYSEYILRYKDVKRSCKSLKIKLVKGDYDFEAWLNGTKGLENEPEKGARCAYCFGFRLQNAAKVATELGCSALTTTLLMSPKKSFSQLEISLQNVVNKLNPSLQIITPDYRKNGGSNEQFKLAKQDKLYHQNYCGCIFGLNHGKSSGEIIEELCSPITAQIQPGSIKARLKLYKKVRKCEQNGDGFELKRRKILNWRLDSGFLKINANSVASYVMFYSHFKEGLSRFSVENSCKIFDGGKDGAILISLKQFNEIAKMDFKSVKELLKNPPKIKKELKIRAKILQKISQSGDGDDKNALCDLSPIIVLDSINAGKYEIRIKTRIFTQIIENMIKTTSPSPL